LARLIPELTNTVSATRRAAGWTQDELARAAGVSRQTVGAIEKGDYSPSTVLALRLSLLLDAPVEALFALPEPARAELRETRARLVRGGGAEAGDVPPAAVPTPERSPDGATPEAGAARPPADWGPAKT
jgi:putative transcriptional regulator